MPEWGVSAMVDIPTLFRTKSLRKATDISVDSESKAATSPVAPGGGMKVMTGGLKPMVPGFKATPTGNLKKGKI